MLAIAGLASLLQITVLPGFLIVRALKCKFDACLTIIFSFALSLIANYFLVFLLTVLGLYISPVVYLIFVCEVLLIFVVHKDSILKLLKSPLSSGFNTVSEKVRKLLSTSYYFFCASKHKIVVTMSSLCIVWLVYCLFLQASTQSVFWCTDDIYSWNDWAVQWFNNKIPLLTFHYPQ